MLRMVVFLCVIWAGSFLQAAFVKTLPIVCYGKQQAVVVQDDRYCYRSPGISKDVYKRQLQWAARKNRPLGFFSLPARLDSPVLRSAVPFCRTHQRSAGYVLRANEASCIHLPSRPQRRVVLFLPFRHYYGKWGLNFQKRKMIFEKVFTSNPCVAPPVRSLKCSNRSGSRRRATPIYTKMQNAPAREKTRTSAKRIVNSIMMIC